MRQTIGRTLLACLFLTPLMAGPLRAGDIVQDWQGAQLPPPPTPKAVKIDPGKTALLLFDFTTQTCSQQRRPRCAANVPALARLLKDARAHNMLVIYSVAIKDTTRKDILPEIAARDSETVLPSLGPDKFIASNLEKDLKARGINTLILTGTAAHTTVLHTGGAAALRGFNVIVPLDGMASNDLFTEAYTAWHLVNAARIMTKVTLTRTAMISY